MASSEYALPKPPQICARLAAVGDSQRGFAAFDEGGGELLRVGKRNDVVFNLKPRHEKGLELALPFEAA